MVDQGILQKNESSLMEEFAYLVWNLILVHSGHLISARSIYWLVTIDTNTQFNDSP